MRRKVAIIGAGRVGSTTAQVLAYKELCDIVLVNRTAGIAQGVALDIQEGAPIDGIDVDIIGTDDYEKIKDSDVVVVTAGIPRKEGMSRDELLGTNAKIVEDICKKVKRYAPHCVLVVLTNPLDAMVYLAKKVTGFPKNRVVGMAGILDSSRFRSFIAAELKVGVDEVSAMVLGGHGDFMVPLPSHSSVAGIPLTELLPKAKIDSLIKRTRDGGAEIIKLEKESSAFYAPASSLALMVESILKDKKTIVPCAAFLEGEYGINGIFVGVPVILGATGVSKVVELKLGKSEQAALKLSASKIKESIKRLM